MKATIISGSQDAQKWILQANIPFVKLRNKARFTYMRDPAEDIYDENEPLPRQVDYQRRIKEDRIKDIINFIKRSIINEKNGEQVSVLFPTAMLLATTLKDETAYQLGDEIDLTSIFDQLDSFYVVDGQHRLRAMDDLYKDVTENRLLFDDSDTVIKDYLDHYVFNCTILLNFDLWEQAQVFADVNFNQTRVNKSLYFSIYGMNYSKNPSDWSRNYIFIAHRLVKFMNSVETSPLKGCIKMLGTGKGFISQAFFAEALMPFIRSPRGMWYVNPRILNTQPNYRYMAVELISYFDAVKKVLANYWPEGSVHRSILCKTTGVGAMVKLMGYLHQIKMDRELMDDLRNQTKAQVYAPYTDFVIPYLEKLKEEGDYLFDLKNGHFSGTGGKGLEHQLFVSLVNIVNR